MPGQSSVSRGHGQQNDRRPTSANGPTAYVCLLLLLHLCLCLCLLLSLHPCLCLCLCVYVTVRTGARPSPSTVFGRPIK